MVKGNVYTQRKKRWVTRFCICLIGFGLLFCSEGLAAGTGNQNDGGIYTAVDGHEIPQEELTDSVIGYEELGSLIHAYNRTVQDIIKNTDTVREEYTEIRDQLRAERSYAKQDKEDAEDEGDMDLYAENASLEAIYKAGIVRYNDAIRKLDRYSSNRDRIILEKRLTNAAQSLMISWQSLSLQKEYLEKRAEVLYARYELSQNQMHVGLLTSDDAQASYRRLIEIQNSLEDLEDRRMSVYQNLCVLLGVDENGGISFKEILPADISRTEGLDLEQDTKEALSNNTDIYSELFTSARGTDARENKKRKLEELKEKVKIQMKQLYEDISQAEQAYDAARVGYENAENAWSGSQLQYSLGMLNKAEFLQHEAAYLDKKTGLETAELNLFQALQVYEWALKGIISDL